MSKFEKLTRKGDCMEMMINKVSEKLENHFEIYDYNCDLTLKNGKKLIIERDMQGFYYLYENAGDKIIHIQNSRFGFDHLVTLIIEMGK